MLNIDDVKIAFFSSKSYDIEYFSLINKKFNFNIKYFSNRLDIDTVSLAKGYNVIVIFVNDVVNKEIADILFNNGIQLIALRCSGYNNIDLSATYKKIHVVRVPSYSPYAVAEHAVALILSLNRKIHKAYYRTRDGNFNLEGLLGFDMFNKTVGIIGTGKIGKVVIKILNGFGMKILAYDKNRDEEYKKLYNFEYVDLDTLYKKSDIISLHCPLTEETFHIINKNSISKMKDGVMLINTGRGHLIDTIALIEGLKTGKIAYAGLDVYEEETDYFFKDFSNSFIQDDVLARLLTFNNVIITSHQGFFTKEALYNIANTTLNNIKDYFEGNRLLNEICYKCDENFCIKEKTGRCW